MKSWKWIVGVLVVAIGLWAVLPVSCGTPGTSVVPSPDGAPQVDAGEIEMTEPAVVEPAAVEVDLDAAAGAEADAAEPEEVAPPVPVTLAEKFVAAGGQKLCLAMVAQLNPDWRMDACSVIGGHEGDEARKEACENQRRPLIKFADDVCRTVIEESLRLDLDPVLVLAVIERESSFGRATWDQRSRAYEVQTDVCHLTLPKSRIVERRPGRREGTELMTWTYGPQAPVAGSVARNRQPVIVEEENDEQVVLNTCAAGERGIMQTTAHELRTAGDAVGLTGTTAERGAALEADPVLQVRLGCQALADHRGLMPPERQADWVDWIHIYNTGTVERSDHGREYAEKIVRHYLAACKGWMQDDSDLLSVKDVEDVWPECARMLEVLDALQAGEE